jgi:hypothetical protein
MRPAGIAVLSRPVWVWGHAITRRLVCLMLVGLAFGVTSGRVHAAIDESHSAFDALLRRHVAWDGSGVASSVSYSGLAADRAALGKVLELYAGVTRTDYEAMSRDQRLAFLINLYNAATLELVLGAWPDLKSIRDLGSLIRSPWKQRVVRLFGELRSLDDIEHGMIRAPGVFDEPRIHFVVNCASIGCPALRPEAITGARLQAQLEDSTRRFMRDASRNRYDPVKGRLDCALRDPEEAHDIRKAQGKGRPGDQQSGVPAGCAQHGISQTVIKGRKGHQKAQGQDRARHGITQKRKRHKHPQEWRLRHPQGIDHEQRRPHGRQRSQPAYDQCIRQRLPQTGGKPALGRVHGMRQHDPHRQKESTRNGHQAHRRGKATPRTCQILPFDWAG